MDVSTGVAKLVIASAVDCLGVVIFWAMAWLNVKILLVECFPRS